MLLQMICVKRLPTSEGSGRAELLNGSGILVVPYVNFGQRYRNIY